jgi:hypothetical protein
MLRRMQDDWIAEFQHLLAANNMAAMELKAPRIPKYIYKYRNFADPYITSLLDGHVWLGSAAKMNDPHDCSFGDDPGTPETPGLPYEEKKKLAEKLQKLITFCSFSETHESSTMWAHYSANHQGFCLEYATADFEPDNRLCLYPVRYSKQRPPISSLIDKSASLRFRINKSDEWSYECEWRLIKNEAKDVPSEAGFVERLAKPSAIYLGSHVRDWDRASMIAVAGEQRGIPVFSMVSSSRTYRMETGNQLAGPPRER